MWQLLRRQIPRIAPGRILAPDGTRVRLLDADTGRDVVTIAPQPSIVQSIGYTGDRGRHYVLIGTTSDGVRVCEVP